MSRTVVLPGDVEVAVHAIESARVTEVYGGYRVSVRLVSGKVEDGGYYEQFDDAIARRHGLFVGDPSMFEEHVSLLPAFGVMLDEQAHR